MKESFSKYYKRVSPSKNKTAVMGMKYKGKSPKKKITKFADLQRKQGTGFSSLENPEGRRRKMSIDIQRKRKMSLRKSKGKGKPKKRSKVKAKGLSAAKAKKILKDGAVRGHPLSKKQIGFFGAIAGGNSNVK